MNNIEKLIEQISALKAFIDARDSSWITIRNTDINLAIEFDRLCEELAKTHDMRGLLYLLDYFDEEFDLEYEGVLECIQNDIGANFTLVQILEAFYKKFDQLITKHVSRAAYFSYWFLDNEMFDDFRKMFNTVKSNQSEKLLNRLDDWADDDYAEERKLLREDMKKW